MRQRVCRFQGTGGLAYTFCEHGPLERLAAGCQDGSVAVKTTAIGCHYSYVAELWFVKQAANSGEVGSLVLGQIFVQNLHAACDSVHVNYAGCSLGLAKKLVCATKHSLARTIVTLRHTHVDLACDVYYFVPRDLQCVYKYVT